MDALYTGAAGLMGAAGSAVSTRFACVAMQPIRLRHSDEFARVPLHHGADLNVRTSLRGAFALSTTRRCMIVL